ncbi:hypothetical protein [Bifidobacterium vespertilionis]|uniref:hypothetical protein n=1 Tax=Bifidobacterium vespertilionis TaxID=2562524 RepID=UPI001BDC23E1|nr:hypothetical protein [Bifidobacterium vespertilionis]MBT1179638.1 hypothetical protein [Bifidobacterium vespertilionis]
MASKPDNSGAPGAGPAIAAIAVVALVSHADRSWVTVLLGVVVLYGLVTDWLDRRR